ncbi:TlpA family protein disulfide reductase [Flavobacterium sp. XS1P32]|uniref:TlpA family protein disulfide reductase n=1 Tax=Flavobacterium sp. XS1P32 TaxID=3401726 RepID=UPI003AAA498B
MKKYLKITIPIAVIGMLIFISYEVIKKINHKKQVAENIKIIPSFQYQDLNGAFFTNKNLKPNEATVFLYFNSECEHCQAETQMIKESIEKFKPFQLVFISFEKPEKIKSFATQYKLLNYDNVHFIWDSKVTFAITFDVKSVPCLVLYDKNKHLIEKIKGQAKVETIIKKLSP